MTELADFAETGTGALHLALARRLVAEAVGTAFLILAVIGSGIMAARLSPDELKSCFDPAFYLKNVDAIFKRLGLTQ